MVNRNIKYSGTVEKALKLMDYFELETPYWGLSALSKKAGLSKATTYRFLSALVKTGFLEHDPGTKQYRLGFKLLELGNRVLERITLRDLALPFMERLRNETKETVHLTMKINGEGAYIEKVESISPIRVVTRIGARGPLYAGASFKILLAYLPPEMIDEILEKKKLKRFTKNTITEKEKLLRELKLIKQRGHAISHGELHEGFTSVAAPIRNRNGEAVAGISVIAPAEKLTSKAIREKDIVRLTKKAADDISLQMGWSGK